MVRKTTRIIDDGRRAGRTNLQAALVVASSIGTAAKLAGRSFLTSAARGQIAKAYGVDSWSLVPQDAREAIYEKFNEYAKGGKYDR